jgi:hypothetical protein
MGCDDRGAELDGGRHDEGIDGMSAGELRASEQRSGPPRDARCQGSFAAGLTIRKFLRQ